MPSRSIEVRLGKLGEVKQLDNVTYDLKIDDRQLRLLINPVQNKLAKYILREGKTIKHFKIMNEIVKYLRPVEDERDDDFKIFISTEMKALAHVSKLSNTHLIYCYNMKQVNTLCDKIQTQGKWTSNWSWDEKDKVFIVECRRILNVSSM